ncbi:MAG: hypothetical protein ACPGJS_13940 [Flammeovirgaceae bacterium]
MNSKFHISTQHIQRFDQLNQDLLIYKPWLWQTKIHHVVFMLLGVNLAVGASLFLQFYQDLSYVLIVGTSTFMGFIYWLHEINQVSIIEVYAQLDAKKHLQRFWAFSLGVFLFAFPNIMLWIARNPSFQLFTPDAMHAYFPGVVVVSALFFMALGIQIWQSVGGKAFSIGLGLMALFVTGFYFTMQMDVLLSVLLLLLIVQLMVNNPKKLAEQSMWQDENASQRKDILPASWIVLGYTSLQLLMPLFLALGSISLIMTLEIHTTSDFFIMGGIPVGIVIILYLTTIFPHYLRTVASLRSLPKHE